jgi:hypothetical protein
MNNWNKLTDSEYQLVWEYVYADLKFNIDNEKGKLISPSVSKRCFDISSFYNTGFSDELYNNLHKSAIKWFRQIAKNKEIYALNWQHDCYSFNPQLPIDKDEFNEWLIPVFPNGDYLFFLTDDFKNGLFADGLNLQLSFWGDEMLELISIEKAEMLIKSGDC